MHSIEETTRLLTLYKQITPRTQFDPAHLAQFLVFEASAAATDTSDGSVSALVHSVAMIGAAMTVRDDEAYSLFCWRTAFGRFSGGLYYDGKPEIDCASYSNVLPLADLLNKVAGGLKESGL